MFAGDPRQLRPTVITGLHDKDTAGNLYHRFIDDGQISTLEYLQLTGWPVYRLTTQLRMVKGTYDWLASIVYSDIPFTYAPSCTATLPRFAMGMALEAYAKKRFPNLKSPPSGHLWPIFINCPGSQVMLDENILSKKSPDQVKIALDFIVDFVKTKGVDSSRLIMLAPYSANLKVINEMRALPQYALLSSMQPASTIDSFQGQEEDVAVIVMGTAHPTPRPGFTVDENRLTVTISRHKCGLLVVGDINVAGSLEVKPNAKGKGKGGASEEKFGVIGFDGEVMKVKAKTLR